MKNPNLKNRALLDFVLAVAVAQESRDVPLAELSGLDSLETAVAIRTGIKAGALRHDPSDIGAAVTLAGLAWAAKQAVIPSAIRGLQSDQTGEAVA